MPSAIAYCLLLALMPVWLLGSLKPVVSRMLHEYGMLSVLGKAASLQM